jgi:hypothetical protein
VVSIALLSFSAGLLRVVDCCPCWVLPLLPALLGIAEGVAGVKRPSRSAPVDATLKNFFLGFSVNKKRGSVILLRRSGGDCWLLSPLAAAV